MQLRQSRQIRVPLHFLRQEVGRWNLQARVQADCHPKLQFVAGDSWLRVRTLSHGLQFLVFQVCVVGPFWAPVARLGGRPEQKRWACL